MQLKSQQIGNMQAVSPGIRGLPAKCAATFIYGFSLIALPLLSILGLPLRMLRRRRSMNTPARVLLTGRFDSAGWARAHVLPIAEATSVGRVFAVVDGPTLPHSRITYLPPPRWLVRLLGRAAAKALWMVRVSLREPPDVIIGYHILPNALSALLVARLFGARAVYQMTGGYVELEGGGFATDDALLKQLATPSVFLESLALCVCRRFDAVIVRGARTRRFLSARAAAQRIDVIAGAVNTERFVGGETQRAYDIAYVGRLMPIKQPEHVVHIVAELVPRLPHVRAAIVGDGPLREALEQLARRLGVQGQIDFLGHLERVEDILRQTKVFLLTSRSEGLSIALAEAMLAGAVPVVADVGDLAELVRDGETGYRLSPGDSADYARRILQLLTDENTWRRMSSAARQRARENNSLETITARWDSVIRALYRAPEVTQTERAPVAAPSRNV